jgi:hypothetical protein
MIFIATPAMVAVLVGCSSPTSASSAPRPTQPTTSSIQRHSSSSTSVASSSSTVAEHATFSWSTPVFVAARPGSNQVAPQSQTVPGKPDQAVVLKNPLDAASCPSVRLCVLVDRNGHIWTSTDPSSRTSSWKKTSIPRDPGVIYQPDLDAISCPSVSFCAAVDWYGFVYVSTDPTGGSSHWPRVFTEPEALRANDQLAAISCVSDILCVATDDGGNVMTSLDPAKRGSEWKLSHITRGAHDDELLSVSCPTRSFCVTVTSDNYFSAGHGYFSNDPGAAKTHWKEATIDTDSVKFGEAADPVNDLGTVSCPSVSLCVAADAGGNLLSTNSPAQAEPWKAVMPFGKAAIDFDPQISCASISMCVYVDQGDAFVSHDPSGSASGWQASDVSLPGGFSPSAVACTKSAFCILTYYNGDVVTGSLSR